MRYVQNGKLWRGFETVFFFICLKTLSHSEVSRGTRWCTGTRPPAVPWPPHSDIKPSLDLRIFFSGGRHLSCTVLRAGNGFPRWSKAGLSRAQSQHLNGNSVNNSGEHSIFSPTFLHPLSSDLLTERQVGVGVQVTGASIVAISVTELTARRYSAICAAGGWRNNGC